MDTTDLTSYIPGYGGYSTGIVQMSANEKIYINVGGAGIVAGSAAAATQAVIGNVAAGSLFATMTSFGMTGVLSALSATGVGSIVSGIAVALL